MRLLALLTAGLFLSVAGAAPVPKANQPPDTESFVGTWKVVAVDGEAESGTAIRYVFDADATARSIHGKGSVATLTWALDTDASPRRLTLIQKEDGSDPRQFDCVYELDGDTLRIAFPSNGEKTPAKVVIGPGTILYEMKRVKGEKKDK